WIRIELSPHLPVPIRIGERLTNDGKHAKHRSRVTRWLRSGINDGGDRRLHHHIAAGSVNQRRLACENTVTADGKRARDTNISRRFDVLSIRLDFLSKFAVRIQTDRNLKDCLVGILGRTLLRRCAVSSLPALSSFAWSRRLWKAGVGETIDQSGIDD